MRRIKTLLVVFLLAGCGASQPANGGPSSSNSPTSSPATPTAVADDIVFDPAPTTVVLEHRIGGGFMTPLYNRVFDAPLLRLYGDGRMIYQQRSDDGTIRWQETKLAPVEMQALLRDVLGQKAILCEPAEVAAAPVADAGATTITVKVQDRTCGATIEALDFNDRPGLTSVGAALLQQMQQANSALQTIERQAAKPYQPEVVTLFVEPGIETPDAVAWTLNVDELRDGNTIKGAEALAVLEQASTPRTFSTNGQYVQAVAVPVLP